MATMPFFAGNDLSWLLYCFVILMQSVSLVWISVNISPWSSLVANERSEFLWRQQPQLCLCDLSFSMWVRGTNLTQERIMSFSLWRKEEECITAGDAKQTEPPSCTKNRTHLPTSLQFRDLTTSQHTVTLVVNKMRVLQAYLAGSSYTGTVLGPSWHDKLCFMMQTTPDSRRRPHSLSIKLCSFSLGNVWSLSDP